MGSLPPFLLLAFTQLQTQCLFFFFFSVSGTYQEMFLLWALTFYFSFCLNFLPLDIFLTKFFTSFKSRCHLTLSMRLALTTLYNAATWPPPLHFWSLFFVFFPHSIYHILACFIILLIFYVCCLFSVSLTRSISSLGQRPLLYLRIYESAWKCLLLNELNLPNGLCYGCFKSKRSSDGFR